MTLSFEFDPLTHEATRLFGYSSPRNDPLEEALFEGFRGGYDNQHQLSCLARSWKFFRRPERRAVYDQGFKLGSVIATETRGLVQEALRSYSDENSQLPESLNEAVDNLLEKENYSQARRILLRIFYGTYRTAPHTLPNKLQEDMDLLPYLPDLISLRDALPSSLIRLHPEQKAAA